METAKGDKNNTMERRKDRNVFVLLRGARFIFIALVLSLREGLLREGLLDFESSQ